jgi:hypothetical protein
MKRSFKVFVVICSFALSLILAESAYAQLTATLLMPSQMPDRVPAWTEELNAQIGVVISNTSRERYDNIRVSVSVRDLDRNIVVLRTKDNDPSVPRFTINPTSTITRNANDILNRRTIQYDANLERVIINTNSIPEGNYEFCVKLLSANNESLLLQDEICKSFIITNPDPPALISPPDGDSVIAETFPVFTWSPVIGNTAGTRVSYKLKIVPLFQGQAPAVALQVNQPIIEKIIPSTSYQYLPSDNRFNSQSGAVGFAWSVQSVKSDNPAQTIARNQGRSEVNTFRLKSSTIYPKKKVIDKSVGKEIAKEITKEINDNLFDDKSTIPQSNVTGKLVWSFRSSELGGKGREMSKQAIIKSAKSSSASVTNTDIITNLTQDEIIKRADTKAYPLANATVKLYAYIPKQSTGTKNPEIVRQLFGTATSDKDGNFKVSFINPPYVISSAGGSKREKGRSNNETGAKKTFTDPNPSNDDWLDFDNKERYSFIDCGLVIESAYFLNVETKFKLKNDIVNEIKLGNILSLARTFRLNVRGVNVLEKQPSVLPDTAVTYEVLRSSSARKNVDFLNRECNQPLASQNSIEIAGISNLIIAKNKASQTQSCLFVHQSGGMYDVVTLRVYGRYNQAITFDTTVDILLVDEKTVNRNGIPVVNVDVNLGLRDRSIVKGRILTQDPNVQTEKYISPGTVTVGLVRKTGFGLADTTNIVRTKTNATTGEFLFDNVPPGEYFLQVAGATAYPSIEGAAFGITFYAAILDLKKPQIVSGDYYIQTSLSTLVGRLIDDIGNPVKGEIIVENAGNTRSLKTDNAGAYAFAVQYGSNNMRVRAPGHEDYIYNYVVGAEENFGVPKEVSDAIQKQIEEMLKKSLNDKTKTGSNNPKDKVFGWIEWVKSEEEVMQSWSNGLMNSKTFSQTTTRTNEPLQTYSPIQAGYGAGKALGVQIKTNTGGVYDAIETAAFGDLFQQSFNGKTLTGSKSFGKDSYYEEFLWSEGIGEPQILDMGELNMTRKTALVLTIAKGKVPPPDDSDSGSSGFKKGNTKPVFYTPISDATVTLYSTASGSGNVQLSSVKSNVKGRASIPGIIAGTISCRIQPPANTYYIPSLVDVMVKPYIDTTQYMIGLELGGMVSGKVTDANGNPLESVRVRVVGYDDIGIETFTKSDGTYQLYGIPQGAVQLSATKEGFIGKKNGTVVEVEKEKAGVNFTLSKSDFTLDNLYGFKVEIEKYNASTNTINGAIINIPSNNVFTIDSKSRLGFTNVKLAIKNGKAEPIGNSIDLDMATDLELRGFNKIPLIIKSLSVSSKSSSIGILQAKSNTATIDWEKFIPTGSLPYSFKNKDKTYVVGSSGDVLPITQSDGKYPFNTASFALKSSEALKLNLWITELAINLNGSTVSSEGIHLKGSASISNANIKEQVTINDVFIKSNGGIGNVDIKLDKQQSVQLGGFKFDLSSITINDKGLQFSAQLSFGVKDIFDAKNIGVSGVVLNGSSISGGSFNVSNSSLTLLNKITVSAKQASGFGLTLTNNNGIFKLSSDEINVSKLLHIDQGIKARFEVSSDYNFLLYCTPNYSTNFADVVKINVQSLLLSTEKKELFVNGTVGLGLPGVASIEGGGFHFYSDGSVSVDELSTSIKLGPVLLDIKKLAFGSNISKPDMSGVGGSGGKDEMLACTWKGFKTENVSLKIPGTDINVTAGFHFLRCDGGGGIAIGAKVMVPDLFPPIAVGPVTVKIQGGGFEVNTAESDYKVMLFASVGVAGTNKLFALDPTVVTVGLSYGAPYLSVAGTLTMLPTDETLRQNVGKAVAMINVGQKMFSVDVSVSDYKVMPGVVGDGGLHVEGRINGGNSYFYAGIYVNVNIMGGLVNANAAVIMGVNIPLEKIPVEYTSALYDGADKVSFSGISLRANTTIGVPKEKKKCVDLGLCDGCVWFGGTADAQLYVNFTNSFAFGFAFNASFGAGAKCGKVGAGVGLSGGLAGGYNVPQFGGWYFSGHLSGSIDLGIYEPDIGIDVWYKNKSFDWSLDL